MHIKSCANGLELRGNSEGAYRRAYQGRLCAGEYAYRVHGLRQAGHSVCGQKVTEISCHGRGAYYLFNDDAFTLIDIGGQDTKIIETERGTVRNFIMNDKCSAGTGRFLEIMAGVLGVGLNEMCELGRESKNHVSISSMCTVFAESEVVSLIGRGTDKADIAYGIVESIATKVKGQMGQLGAGGRVYLTGGLCETPFVIDMLSQKLGTEVISAPLARYAGAIGAAMFAREIFVKNLTRSSNK